MTPLLLPHLRARRALGRGVLALYLALLAVTVFAPAWAAADLGTVCSAAAKTSAGPADDDAHRLSCALCLPLQFGSSVVPATAAAPSLLQAPPSSAAAPIPPPSLAALPPARAPPSIRITT